MKNHYWIKKYIEKLIYALEYKHIAESKNLLNVVVQDDLSNTEKRQLSKLTASTGEKDRGEIWLNKMAGNLSYQNGGTALFQAAANGYEEIVELYLDKAEALKNYTNTNFLDNIAKVNALHISVSNEKEKVIDILIEQAGKDIAEKSQGVALNAAALYNHKTIILEKLLNTLEKISDEYKGKALMSVIAKDHYNMAEILLKQAGDMDLSDRVCKLKN